jgi:hypothetical protein
LKQKEFKLEPVSNENTKEAPKGLEKQGTTKIKKQVTIKDEPSTNNKEQEKLKKGMTKKGDGETIKEEGPNEGQDDLNKDDVISSS